MRPSTFLPSIAIPGASRRHKHKEQANMRRVWSFRFSTTGKIGLYTVPGAHPWVSRTAFDSHISILFAAEIALLENEKAGTEHGVADAVKQLACSMK